MHHLYHLIIASEHQRVGIEQREKKNVPLFQIPDISIDEHAVHLGMNGLYEDLKAVERASFRDLNLLAEPLHLQGETET